MLKTSILSLLFLLLASCTDAGWDQYRTLGKRMEAKCYSGPLLVFHGLSTGKVKNETNSDGYFARWEVIQVNGHWKHVDTSKPLSGSISGNCVMLYVD